MKLANSKLEEARISLRSARDETWSDIQKKKKKEEWEKMINSGLRTICKRL